MADERRYTLTVAGIVHDVYVMPFSLLGEATGYISMDTLEWLGGSRQFTVMAISVSEKQTDAAHVTEVAQAVADRMKRAGEEVYFVNVYQPGHHFAWTITQGVFFVLGVLGYMTVALSALLIINTITAIMTQQTRQIGIMKAVGGGNTQVFAMYVVLILGLGLVALLLAIPIANEAARSIGGGMAQYLNFNPLPSATLPTVRTRKVPNGSMRWATAASSITSPPLPTATRTCATSSRQGRTTTRST